MTIELALRDGRTVRTTVDDVRSELRVPRLCGVYVDAETGEYVMPAFGEDCYTWNGRDLAADGVPIFR